MQNQPARSPGGFGASCFIVNRTARGVHAFPNISVATGVSSSRKLTSPRPGPHRRAATQPPKWRQQGSHEKARNHPIRSEILSFVVLRRFVAFCRRRLVGRPYLYVIRTMQRSTQAFLDHMAKLGQGGVGVDEERAPTGDRFWGRFSGRRAADFPRIDIAAQRLDHLDQLGRISRGMDLNPGRDSRCMGFVECPDSLGDRWPPGSHSSRRLSD